MSNKNVDNVMMPRHGLVGAKRPWKAARAMDIGLITEGLGTRHQRSEPEFKKRLNPHDRPLSAPAPCIYDKRHSPVNAAFSRSGRAATCITNSGKFVCIGPSEGRKFGRRRSC